jgi:hypothetical protein
MINSVLRKGCTAIMAFDTVDKIIVGRFPDIDDIITCHGESVSGPSEAGGEPPGTVFLATHQLTESFENFSNSNRGHPQTKHP